MKVSQNAINLIKEFEGCKLCAYKVSKKDKYYTIGYGHYGKDVTVGMRITQNVADALLIKDLEKFEKHVSSFEKNYIFTQSQFDALVSFAYNVGSIKKITQNGTRSISAISNAFTRYCYSNGKFMNGLYKRRIKEKELFDSVVKKTNEEIATEVINGLWGNGTERKNKLIKAGYSYEAIQKIVNKKLLGV